MARVHILQLTGIQFSSVNLLKASYVLVTGADTIKKVRFLPAKSLAADYLTS